MVVSSRTKDLEVTGQLAGLVDHADDTTDGALNRR